MDKRLTHYFANVLLLFTLSLTHVLAQKEYGNEWIDTSQTYLRIPIVRTGFYKITLAELLKTGFPLDTSQKSTLQLFRRGKEVALGITKGKDLPASADYISFYAEKNDGARDSLLYVTPKAMPHAYYSLYSDTAVYFLTCHQKNIAGKRITVSSANITNDFISWHLNEVLQIQAIEYPAGNLYPIGSNYDTGTALTTYDTGEGWTGKELLNNQSETLRLIADKPFLSRFELAEAEVLLVGRSAGNHQITATTGESKDTTKNPDTLKLSDYNALPFRISLISGNISPDRKMAITLTPVHATGSVSVSYVRWRYPQYMLLPADASQKIFYYDHDLSYKTAIIKNASHWQFYDCSDPYLIQKKVMQDSLLPLNGARRIIAFKEFLPVASMRLVRFKFIHPETDYLIISHPLIQTPVQNGKDPVQDYADYRRSLKGGNFKPVVLTSSEIFDQFNYGEPGPLGIRNAISFLYQKAALRFVLLLGKSIDPQTARHQLRARENDMIPNGGWPGSDMALTMGLYDTATYWPLVPIGRVNASGSKHVYDYLKKVKAYESQDPSAPWRKNILHLSGGHTINERVIFREYVTSFEKKVFNTSLAPRVQTIAKKTDELTEAFSLDTVVNKGIALITLFGHSGLHSADIDIGTPDNVKQNFQNDPFYPAVLVNGCALGNIYYTTPALSNDWILSPDKGAILFLAHTHNGVTSSLKHYTDSFYDVLADSLFVNEPFGIIQQEAIRRNIRKYPTLSDGITAQQMNLLGDPAIKIFPAKLPDYTWEAESIQFSDPEGKLLSTASDSITIRMVIRNNGRFNYKNYEISIHRITGSGRVSDYKITHPPTASQDTLYFTLLNEEVNPGKEKWRLIIDPDNRIAEEKKDNNVLDIDLTLSENKEPEPVQIKSAGVLPNPSNYEFKFFIDFASSHSSSSWTISVFDVHGRTIYYKELTAHQGINLHLWQPVNIPAGIYPYRIKPETEYKTRTGDAQKGLNGTLLWMH